MICAPRKLNFTLGVEVKTFGQSDDLKMRRSREIFEKRITYLKAQTVHFSILDCYHFNSIYCVALIALDSFKFKRREEKRRETTIRLKTLKSSEVAAGESVVVFNAVAACLLRSSKRR